MFKNRSLLENLRSGLLVALNKVFSCLCNKVSLVLLFSLTYFSQAGHAQYLTGPVAQGLGGAGRAASDDGEQVFLNPAAIVHASPFTSSLFYQDGYAARNEHDKVIGLSLADNTENLFFSGGYAYAQRKRTYDALNSREEQYHQISLGRTVIPHVSLGLSVSYLSTKLVGGDDYEQWDGHVGMLYNPTPELGLGFVFYNLNKRDEEVPVDVQNQDQIAAGVHYIFMPSFRGRMDIIQQQTANPNKKMRYQAGVESKFTEFFMVRLGVENDGLADRDHYTLGLGFDGPRLKVDYFYRKNSEYNEGALHGVDMRMPFW